MATIGLLSFNWEGFQSILKQPTSELASRLASQRLAKSIPYSTSTSDLPQGETDLAEYLSALFASADWYANKSVHESRTIDGVIDYLFQHESPLAPLNLETLSDGISLEILGIATGRAEIDPTRMTAKSRQIFVNWISPVEEEECPELAELGSRPFRHGSWSRKVVEDRLKIHNPFLEGGEIVHVPDYSIHSPDQVEQLRQNLVSVGDRVRRNLHLLKSKKLREAALTNFEDDLVTPIEKASAGRLAVFAWQDY